MAVAFETMLADAAHEAFEGQNGEGGAGLDEQRRQAITAALDSLIAGVARKPTSLASGVTGSNLVAVNDCMVVFKSKSPDGDHTITRKTVNWLQAGILKYAQELISKSKFKYIYR
jgi:hypothetical protein